MAAETIPTSLLAVLAGSKNSNLLEDGEEGGGEGEGDGDGGNAGGADPGGHAGGDAGGGYTRDGGGASGGGGQPPADSWKPESKIGLGAALGAGVGADLAIKAGVLASAPGTAPAIMGAAGAGIVAAGIAGWEIGKFLDTIPWINESTQWVVDKITGKEDPIKLKDVTDLKHWKLDAPAATENNWKLHFTGVEKAVDAWWYVAHEGETISLDTIAYSNPHTAIDDAAATNGVVGLFVPAVEIQNIAAFYP